MTVSLPPGNTFPRRKFSATRDWLNEQKQHANFNIAGENDEDVSKRISSAFKKAGFNPKIKTSEVNYYPVDAKGRKDFSNIKTKTVINVFGERGRINRIGAYFVHVALLLLFLGHFVANQTGFDADLRLMPGQVTNQIQMVEIGLNKTERYNVQLPFTITCTDIQQKLIDTKGSIDIQNTMDWRTQIKLTIPLMA